VILLVSHAEDDHLAPVRSELERTGREAVVVDTSLLPTAATVTAEHGSGDRWRIGLPDGEIDLSECGSGWWRRPLAPTIDAGVTDPDAYAFAANETHEAMAGFWDALPIEWISPPRVIERTMMKTWQLPVASSLGLRIPRTMVTSDPARAREFVESVGVGRVICKAFSASTEAWRETRLVGHAELDQLGQVAVAPVIFQELVPAVVDLRVTVVGDEVFAAEISSQETPYPLDFRLHLDRVPIRATTLPDRLVDRLLAFVRRAGLRYGAIDLRRTPEGDDVFLEVNPAGQWLFVQERTGQPITEAVCRLLGQLDQSAVRAA